MSHHQSSSGSSIVKFGVALPEKLVREMDRLVREQGYSSRSQLVAEAVRFYLSSVAPLSSEGKLVGVIVVVYDHEVSHAEERLTDVQHEHLSDIIATMHIHLSKRLCMLLIAVRGEARRVRVLVSKLRRIRGVIHVAPHLVAAETLGASSEGEEEE